ncbi:MAG: SIS domain-containing protein [Inquilinus sp.]|nr:SIS domain-containing protein [Inquilinus sp.]
MTTPDDPARATQMLREAEEAPAAVARQLAANADAVGSLAERLKSARPRFAVTTARGSSAHAATFGKYLIETRLGLVTAAAAPSVATLYGARLDMANALFIAVSQSGRSPDLVDQAAAARKAGALTVALVNVADSPLAATCEAVLPLHAGEERSVAATKSYIASLAALCQLTALWSGDQVLLSALDRLPDTLRVAAGLDWSAALEPLAAEQDMLVVGRGFGFAIANEAALKMKETCFLHAESFSAAELQHGPVTLVDDDYPVLVFSQEDETRPGVLELVEALRGRGANVFVAEPGPAAPGRLPAAPPLHPACDPIAMVQSFYGLAARLSVRRGLDPDQPRHLRKVTLTR